MKRRVLIILLFLLLVSGGAIVNIAVAWGVIVRPMAAHYGPAEPAHAVPRWCTLFDTDIDYTQMHLQSPNGGFGYDVLYNFGNAPREDGTTEQAVSKYLRSGFPFRALAYACHSVGGGGRPPGTIWRDDWGIRLPGRTAQGCHPSIGGCLPLRPLWPGLIAGSVFYALILFPIVRAPSVLRRLIRRKRGRCPKCGYDLRGQHDAGCPECGWGRTVRDGHAVG